MKGMNTRIMTAEFEYLAPETVGEAVDMLNRQGSEAKVIAGGTDLLVQMKKEVISPRCLIDIRKIPEMSLITADRGWLRIGSATKWREVLAYCRGDERYAALYDAVYLLGKVQVRNMGTIGGNLCTASPAADSAPPLLVFDSRVKLLSVDGERVVRLEEFFTGVNETVMAPNEIMMEIQIPPVEAGWGSAFTKTGRVGADISKISCAVAVARKEDRCVSCRIALGAVASVPILVRKASRFLEDRVVDPPRVEKMGQRVAKEIQPITDIRSTDGYRRALGVVLSQDVFWRAWQRAGDRR